jgi:hypothetical protein
MRRANDFVFIHQSGSEARRSEVERVRIGLLAEGMR